MKVKLTSNWNEMEVELHDHYRAPNGIEEYRSKMAISDRVLQQSNVTMLDGMVFGYGEMTVLEDLRMECPSDIPHLEMQFQLDGQSVYSGDALENQELTLDSGHHGLFFSDGNFSSLYVPQSAHPHRFLGVRILPEQLERFFTEEEGDRLGILWKKVGKLQSHVALSGKMPITTEMNRIIQSIIHCPYNASLKRIFLEAKVLELLTLQLHLLQQGDRRDHAFPKAMRDKLFHVKEIIEQNYQQEHSLRNLALQGGLNEFDLKKNFKLLFNQTVFGMITDVRLDKVRELLLEKEVTIAEATYLVGYKSPQHLSAAFKRKFGYSPGKLKRCAAM